MSVEKIYQEVAAAGTPLELPGDWRALPSDPSFFRLADAAALWEALLRKFAPQILIDSGVGHAGDDDTLVMNPLLTSPKTILWALRKKPGAPPFQLVADLKCVHSKSWAFAAALFEYRTAPMIAAARNRVAVVFSMTDLAILRSLKMPAVPAGGLHFLPGPRSGSFCKLMGLDRKPSQSPNRLRSVAPPALVLFDWSVANGAPMDLTEADRIWKYWRNLQRNLGWEIDEYQRLLPTAAELSKVRFLVQHEGWDRLREVLFDGPYENSKSLGIDPSQERRPPGSLTEALQSWRRAGSSSSDPLMRRLAWNDVRELHDRQILDPLAREALATADPIQRNMLSTLADLSRLLYPQILQLTERLSQAVGEKGAGAGNLVPKEDFQQLMAGVDRVLALQQGIQACRFKKPFPMIRTPRPQASRVDLQRSASTPKNSRPSDATDSSPGSRAAAP